MSISGWTLSLVLHFFADFAWFLVSSSSLVAESVKAGIEKAGGTATIHQIAETLPGEVLTAMHAPPKAAYPVISPADMVNYDAFIFGVCPTS